MEVLNYVILAYVKNKGAVLGLTTEVGVADLDVDNPLILRRYDCNDYPPKNKQFIF